MWVLMREVEFRKMLMLSYSTSEGNPWLRHSSHPWHLARPPAAAALACFFKEFLKKIKFNVGE
jgi:hypothetical protein